jgi:polyisoprenoid-binding protein YceI
LAALARNPEEDPADFFSIAGTNRLVYRSIELPPTNNGDPPMKRLAVLTVLIAALGSLARPARAADTYKVDPVHSFVLFRAHHAGAGYVWGRFNDPAGTFVLDEADVTKSNFSGEIQVANIDTHNEQRDTHLKSPDFFDAKQFPTITFKSTAVARGDAPNTIKVTGDLSMHGVTKSITVPVELTGKGQFPPGTARAGIEVTFTVKMSDYKIKGLPGAVGDEIRVIVALEGIKQ